MPKVTKFPKTDNPHWVQKSHALMALAKCDWNITTLKVLDAYLDAINIRDPKTRKVVFKRKQIEELFGSRINRDEMQLNLDALSQPIHLGDGENSLENLVLFPHSKADKDPDTNEWVSVSLNCSDEAMQYFFDDENFKYFKYKLHNILPLTSRFSYYLFLYLVQNQYRKQWEITIEELRVILNALSPTYNEFFRFNGMILSKAYKEVNEKTDLKFEYQPQRSGRKVDRIRFFITQGLEYPSEQPEKMLSESSSDSDNPVQTVEINDDPYGFDEDADFTPDPDITGIN